MDTSREKFQSSIVPNKSFSLVCCRSYCSTYDPCSISGGEGSVVLDGHQAVDGLCYCALSIGDCLNVPIMPIRCNSLLFHIVDV